MRNLKDLETKVRALIEMHGDIEAEFQCSYDLYAEKESLFFEIKYTSKEKVDTRGVSEKEFLENVNDTLDEVIDKALFRRPRRVKIKTTP